MIGLAELHNELELKISGEPEILVPMVAFRIAKEYNILKTKWKMSEKCNPEYIPMDIKHPIAYNMDMSLVM